VFLDRILFHELRKFVLVDEKRLPTTTYRKSEEIGPAWVLSSPEGSFVLAASLHPRARRHYVVRPRKGILQNELS